MEEGDVRLVVRGVGDAALLGITSPASAGYGAHFRPLVKTVLLDAFMIAALKLGSITPIVKYTYFIIAYE